MAPLEAEAKARNRIDKLNFPNPMEKASWSWARALILTSPTVSKPLKATSSR